MGNFSSKNELGFHGSTGQNLREEEELFGAKDHVSQGINFDRVCVQHAPSPMHAPLPPPLPLAHWRYPHLHLLPLFTTVR